MSWWKAAKMGAEIAWENPIVSRGMVGAALGAGYGGLNSTWPGPSSMLGGAIMGGLAGTAVGGARFALNRAGGAEAYWKLVSNSKKPFHFLNSTARLSGRHIANNYTRTYGRIRGLF